MFGESVDPTFSCVSFKKEEREGMRGGEVPEAYPSQQHA